MDIVKGVHDEGTRKGICIWVETTKVEVTISLYVRAQATRWMTGEKDCGNGQGLEGGLRRYCAERRIPQQLGLVSFYIAHNPRLPQSQPDMTCHVGLLGRTNANVGDCSSKFFGWDVVSRLCDSGESTTFSPFQRTWQSPDWSDHVGHQNSIIEHVIHHLFEGLTLLFVYFGVIGRSIRVSCIIL